MYARDILNIFNIFNRAIKNCYTYNPRKALLMKRVCC